MNVRARSRRIKACILAVGVGLVALSVMVGALGTSGGATRPQNSKVKGMDTSNAKGSFTGDFVDIDDQAAMEHWARHMCRGLKVAQVAQELDTEATVSAVAHALMDRQVESPRIQAAIVAICEEELKSADGN